MQFTELSSLNMAKEIENIIENTEISDKRLISLLNELIMDNISTDIVNISVIKFGQGELSEKDLLISLNKYKSSSVSVTS